MEKIADTTYYEVWVEPENSILIYKWKPTILELDLESYKEGFLEALKYLYEYKPKYVVQHSKEQVYPITGELQKWISNNITPKFIEAGVKKIAYVMPEDFVSKLALEQLVLKLLSITQGMKRMFFDDLDTALKWLKK